MPPRIADPPDNLGAIIFPDRDWVAEQTTFASELAEVALAQVNSDKTEAAYLRSDRREQRAKPMMEWAVFCASDLRAAVQDWGPTATAKNGLVE